MNEKEKIKIKHQLEEFFDVDPGSTEVEVRRAKEPVVEKHRNYDTKDTELELDIKRVYEEALTSYKTGMDALECTSEVDPKYEIGARQAAASFLNIALAAATNRANMKAAKDKLELNAKKISTSEDGLKISGNRTELLRELKKALSVSSDEEPIEGEVIESEEPKDSGE